MQVEDPNFFHNFNKFKTLKKGNLQIIQTQLNMDLRMEAYNVK